jgi:hypothetical protein
VTTGAGKEDATGTEEAWREEDHAGSSWSVARVHSGAHAPRNFPRRAVVDLVKGFRSAPMTPTSSGMLLRSLYLETKMPTYKELVSCTSCLKDTLC